MQKETYYIFLPWVMNGVVATKQLFKLEWAEDTVNIL